MARIKNILVATDYSENAPCGNPRSDAQRRTERGQAGNHGGAAKRVQLDQFIAALGPRRQLISGTVQYGHIRAVLREHASRMHADLIAVGKTRGTLPQPMTADGVTKRLTGEISCDLLVAPSPFVPELDSREGRHGHPDARRRDHEVFL